MLVAVVAIACAQDYPPSGQPAPNTDETAIGSLGVQLITQFLTGDFIRRKLQVLFDIVDLKARLIYVISSFLTTENLIAVRRFLDWVCRFGNFLNQFLPNVEETDNPKTALLGFIVNLFSSLTSAVPATEAPVPSYGPPVPYGIPKTDSNDFTVQPFIASTSTSLNVKRSPDPAPGPDDTNGAPIKLSDLGEEEVRMMLKHKEGIMTLSKLITATRR
ncbi:hypothetical protein HHI36_021924 [Cryptolaemus montrouzieri]|uniref:Uncharacterized protein n=1 Tax=Cryptolaemus montrouzieri TaxID=559131 RepID=A0ABD2MY65_9CUCU